MKSDRLNDFLGRKSQNPKNTGAGLSMADILDLPDRQQQIINWIIRNKECTLSEIANYLNTDESATRSELDALVQQGYLQETQSSDSSCYSVKLVGVRRSQRRDEGVRE